MSPASKPFAISASVLAIPISLVAVLGSAGCGSAVRVDVPAQFHGRLTVHCTSIGSNEAMLRADTNGVADGPCPSVQTGVLVYRDGAPVLVGRQPNWTSTHDGIPTSVHIQVD